MRTKQQIDLASKCHSERSEVTPSLAPEERRKGTPKAAAGGAPESCLKAHPRWDLPRRKSLNAEARLLRGFTPRNDRRDGSAPHNGGTFVIASGAKQSGEAGSARISRHSERSDETLRSAQGDLLTLIFLGSDSGAEESKGGVTPPLHWQDVIETARREGLSLLLYKSLKDSNGLLPQEYLEELRREYFTTLGRNKYYFRELVRCLKVMDVPVILLKGASLLPTVYNDLGARPLGDFDILIQRRDLEKIKGCLVSLGYEPHGGSGLYANSIYFIKREEPVLPLEVHWHIENAMFPNFERLKMERMWQAALPVKLEDYQGLIFAPHHQLIHLSVHALKHSYDRLILLWDMHQVINYYGERLNWEGLIKEASDFCLSRPLFYGLYLTKLLMNTNVPRYVLDRLKPLSLGLEERAFVYFIKRGIRKPGLQYLVYFPMNRGMVDKMRFLWWAFFPPRDILSEMEALDDSEIGAAHYLRCFSRRFEWAWRLYRCK